MKESKRLDGRGLEDVRAISSEVGILPRAHGSALFSRGETQAVTLATLGTSEDAQEFDSYTGGENEKKFILHYNFPNFSVGETGRISGPGRREIGHGALAERSIEPMLPLDTYPYAIRVTSEALQVHGGYGFTNDYPISRIYRGVRYGTLGGGATEALKDLVGKKLVEDFDPVDGFLSMGTF